MKLKEVLNRKLLENYDFDDDEEEDLSHLVSVKVAEALRPNMAHAAQVVYDKWDEEDIDTYAGGGICHYIADAICDVLYHKNIECSPVSSCHEQHVYVIARFLEGVYSIDIHHSNYETGGGFSWKKIHDVEFSPRDIDFYKISYDPRDYHQAVEEY